MARSLSKIIVVDIECTCWEQIPRGEQNEVIEVGCVELLLPSLTIGNSESLLVLPTKSTISEFCTALTGWLPEYICTHGRPFADVCKELKSKYSKYTFASWGDYDRNQFNAQCLREGVPYPFGPTHLNVKNLFAIKHMLNKEVGMVEALNKLGMTLEGTHHRGIDDALNISKILVSLLEDFES